MTFTTIKTNDERRADALLNEILQLGLMPKLTKAERTRYDRMVAERDDLLRKLKAEGRAPLEACDLY